MHSVYKQKDIFLNCQPCKVSLGCENQAGLFTSHTSSSVTEVLKAGEDNCATSLSNYAFSDTCASPLLSIGTYSVVLLGPDPTSTEINGKTSIHFNGFWLRLLLLNVAGKWRHEEREFRRMEWMLGEEEIGCHGPSKLDPQSWMNCPVLSAQPW